MNQDDSSSEWRAIRNIWRPNGRTGFNDLSRIVASYYEMYDRACAFIAPWNAKQIGKNFPYEAPDRELLRSAIGTPRNIVHPRAKSCMVEAIYNFCVLHKGKRQLITPSITTHHSAQLPQGAFTFQRVNDKIQLGAEATNKPIKNLHRLDIFGAEEPVYLDLGGVDPGSIGFVILRPKLGKLGTPNISKWEVILFKKRHTYIVDHVDSNLNPRWSGIL